MKRKIVIVALFAVLFALPVQAQQPGKVYRIGYLTSATPDGQSARIEPFRQGLRELGYVIELAAGHLEFRFNPWTR